MHCSLGNREIPVNASTVPKVLTRNSGLLAVKLRDRSKQTTKKHFKCLSPNETKSIPIQNTGYFAVRAAACVAH